MLAGNVLAATCSVPCKAILPLARPATISRARAAETGPKANSYHLDFVRRKETPAHRRQSLAFPHQLLPLPGDGTFPLFVHRRNTYHTEPLFVSTFIPIQTLAKRGGIQAVVLNPFAAFIPVLGLYHVVLDAEFLEPAVQMEPEGTRFITGHDFVRELLLFDHEQE